MTLAGQKHDCPQCEPTIVKPAEHKPPIMAYLVGGAGGLAVGVLIGGLVVALAK